MKRIVRRVQTLNERAAELTAAAGQLPNRVAELREAMTATSGQLQTLKSDIQVNVADLKMDREDDLSAAIAEIAGHAPVLAKAGFLLDALDVEVSPVQRLIVQLVRFEDVETLEIQPLIQQYQQLPTLRAILSAILKARAMVSTIDIDGLDYHKLIIGIGPVPTIRLCWRAPEAAPSASSVWQPTASQPLASSTSFFGPPLHSVPTSPAPQPETAWAEPAEYAEPVDYAEPVEYTDSVEYATPIQYEAAYPTAAATIAPPPLPQAPAHAPPISKHSDAPPPLPTQAQAPVDPLARFKVMPTLGRET